MNKRRLFIAAAVLSCAVLLIIGMSSAYLTDIEVKDNIITIGRVSISLTETPFDPDTVYTVVPGSKQGKAPKLANDGNKDEFVFLRITVPKADITLLEETGENKGKPRDPLNEVQQIFKLNADSVTGDTDVIEAAAGEDVVFSYHSGSSSSDGWVLLSTESKSETEGGNTAYWDEYVFGYNRKMSPGAVTKTLFDEVQLKSFIDGEVTGEISVGVYGYGIQADRLKPDQTVTQDDLSAEHLTEATLQGIYTIVRNKAEKGGTS